MCSSDLGQIRSQTQLNPADPANVGRRYQSAIPMGRYVNPAEIANTVQFLCSDFAWAITGAQYIFDGSRAASPQQLLCHGDPDRRLHRREQGCLCSR